MIDKFNFVFDRTKKSQQLKKIILRKYQNYNTKNADCIIVGGGDGFMLNILKKYHKFNLPFYGINCGSFGFLMNNYFSKNLIKKINKAKVTTISPLSLTALSKKNNKKKLIAINEVSLFRQSRQTASLSLSVKKKLLLKS